MCFFTDCYYRLLSGSEAGKKYVSADLQTMDAGVAWIGAVFYTLQIYFDFSGYSDMAIGLGKIFGFHFSENFNYPYISKSIREFWRRWHISLSSWFRDYLYIPLGGSRRGNVYLHLCDRITCLRALETGMAQMGRK